MVSVSEALLLGPTANSAPPFLAPAQMVVRFGCPICHVGISQGFVWPEMEAIGDAKLIGQPFHRLEGVYGIALPSFASIEDVGAESIAGRCQRFSGLPLTPTL